jgi:hypothetical protein
MRNLPILLLERHLAKVYKKFKLIYGNSYVIDSLQHLSVDPRTLSKKELAKYPAKYFETVL